MKHLKQSQTRRGFTLVELLVVIVIATIVLSIAIPRIRVVNKERNLREAARVVGAAFANASQRALVDGSAGVRITRNANIVDDDGDPFAATEISLLRRVPNFTGDQFGETIVGLAGNVASILKPLEQDSLSIVQVGDFISFGGSSVQFRIRSLMEKMVNGTDLLDLTLERGTDSYMPLPSTASGNPSYVIHRRPRVLRSSTVELPRGNMIDLRYSGFEYVSPAMPADPPTYTYPQDAPAADVGADYTIDIVFKEDGAIDQIFYVDTEDADGDRVFGALAQIPLGPLYLMIAETSLSDASETIALTSDPQSLWVAVANNGSSNIGYVNVQTPGQTEEELFGLGADEFGEVIQNSRDNSISTAATQ